jgi:hypothetical protein
MDGKARLAAPALEAADWTGARAQGDCCAYGVNYGDGICRARVLYDVSGRPQLVVMGSQVGVPAMVQAAWAIFDSGNR